MKIGRSAAMLLAAHSVIVSAKTEPPASSPSRIEDTTICTIVKISPDAYHPQTDVVAATASNELGQIIDRIESDISYDISTRLESRLRNTKIVRRQSEHPKDLGTSLTGYLKFGKLTLCSTADVKVFMSIDSVDNGGTYLVEYKIVTAKATKALSFQKPSTYVTGAGRPQFPLQGIVAGLDVELSLIAQYIKGIFGGK